MDKSRFKATISSMLNLPSIPQAELDALRDLYDSTSGPLWHWIGNGTKWNFAGNPNPCAEDWQGIVCSCTNTAPDYHPYAAYYFYSVDPPGSASTCNVQKLTLIGYHLNGTLPRSIGNFSVLTHLHVCRNTLLGGGIPSEVGYLSMLSYLSFSKNSLLQGQIPHALGSLTGLKYLCLYVR
jgi:Leucine-rich repeat (LRR) protein